MVSRILVSFFRKCIGEDYGSKKSCQQHIATKGFPGYGSHNSTPWKLGIIKEFRASRQLHCGFEGREDEMGFPVFLLLYDATTRLTHIYRDEGQEHREIDSINCVEIRIQCPRLCSEFFCNIQVHSIQYCPSLSTLLYSNMDFGSPLLRAWSNFSRPPSEPVSVEQEPDVVEGVVNKDQANGIIGTAQSTRKRNLQCVSSKAQRVRVLKWMLETVESTQADKRIISSAVAQFPDVFRSFSAHSNLQKCARWWKERDTMLQQFEKDHLSLSHTYLGNRKRVELKARPGRGRKTAEWCNWLYPLLRCEFDRLRKTGVKFSPQILLLLAKNVISTNPHPTYGPSIVLLGSSKPLIDPINARWIQQFQETQGIVHRTQTGKLQVSPAKTEFIERSTAYHMGQLQRGFASGELNEDLIENMDETHFIVNMDNKKTLGFRGDTEVKYADVVSGSLGMTMVVKCTGGVAAKIAVPFMIFLNPACSYPIRGTPDNISGVAYRTSKKSFMTNELLAEFYRERRVNWADPSGRTKIQFVDNCPGHNLIPECIQALDRIKTQVRFFPANSTHLTQPCDSFVISKIKDAWRRRWDAKKMDMIQEQMWQGDGRKGTSGALKNPGWSYFLQLAADSVRDVNAQVDKKYGISYARRAMIRCGLAKGVDGEWSVHQLTGELQEIIKKYPRNFAGFRDGLPAMDCGSIVPPVVRSIENVIPDHELQSITVGLGTYTTGIECGSENEQSDEDCDAGIFEEGQGPNVYDTEQIEALMANDSGLWGFLNSQYNV